MKNFMQKLIVFLALATSFPALAANTTIPLLSAGSAISAGDLFITRQGADTSDKKVTGTQLKTFMGGGVAGSSGDLQTNSSGSFGAFTPGAGIQTFLTTPSGANLTTALTTPLTVAGGGTNSGQTGNAGLNNIRGTSQLPHWNKALSKVISGKGNARVLIIGDSTTQGFYSLNTATGNMQSLSYPTQLANILTGAGIMANASTVTGGAASDRTTTTTMLTLGSGWTYGAVANTTSLGGQAMYAPSGAGGTAAYSPGIPVDTFKFWYLTAAGAGNGNLNYAIDAGGTTTIDETAAESFASATATTTLGTHTLNFTNGGVGNSFIVAMEAYDSSKSQVMIYNAGWDGAKSADWSYRTKLYSPAKACGTFAPDLVIINLQIGDMKGAVTSLATYTANLQSLITDCQVGGATDVVLMTSNHINPADSTSPTSEATQLTYANAVRALALTQTNGTGVTGIPVVDEFANLISWAWQDASPSMMYLSGTFPQDLHPNYYGYGLMARDIASTILPTAGGASAAASSGTVTSASVTTANGVSATVATATTTPAFTFTLGAITPTTVNGVTIPTTTDTAALLGTAQTYTKGQRVTPVTDSISTATFTPDFSASNNHNITLVHASCPCTLANPTNIVAGQSGVIVVNQSATGSDLINTYGSDYIFTNTAAPTLSTAASAVDELSYYVVDSTHIRIAPLTSTAVAGTTATATPGTGVTSCTCATAACTSLRGTYTIVGGTATTGTLCGLAWTATPAAYVCTASENGGSTNFGIGNSVATTTGMNITSAISVIGATFTVNYSCQP